MTNYNKIYKLIMQVSTVNSTVNIPYRFIGIDTGRVTFRS